LNFQIQQLNGPERISRSNGQDSIGEVLDKSEVLCVAKKGKCFDHYKITKAA
jgi:hypothetical protein